MKASQIGLWVVIAVVAWCGWIVLDMTSPAKASSIPSASLAEIKNSSLPVMVEFYADWCGPCRAVAPRVEEFSNEVAGKAKVMRLNVDEERGLAASYSVRSIPTFIVFKGGKEVSREMGAISKARMRELVGL